MPPDSFWQLSCAVNGFKSPTSNELVTQVDAGRGFQVIGDCSDNSCDINECARLEVRLLEDGYRCWLNVFEVINQTCTHGGICSSFFNFSVKLF